MADDEAGEDEAGEAVQAGAEGAGGRGGGVEVEVEGGGDVRDQGDEEEQLEGQRLVVGGGGLLEVVVGLRAVEGPDGVEDVDGREDAKDGSGIALDQPYDLQVVTSICALSPLRRKRDFAN